MKFEQLAVGQAFEFIDKTSVGCGMFNGPARKKSADTYSLDSSWWITRTVGNQSVAVNPLGE